MSRGRAGPLHEHSYMQYGKGMDLVMEVNVQKCSRKWSSIVTSFTSFYFRYDSSIFRFVNSLFYVGRVHLLTISVSLKFGLFVCLDGACLFKQPMLSLKDKKNLHSTCGTFLTRRENKLY
jgi:hypothetical protein